MAKKKTTSLNMVDFIDQTMNLAFDGDQSPTYKVTEATARKRLLAGAEFLRKLKLPKRGKFEFEILGSHRGTHAPKEENYCGTSGCAMGWFGIKKFGDFRGEWREDEHSSIRVGDPIENSWDTTQQRYTKFHKKSLTAWQLRVTNRKTQAPDYEGSAQYFGITFTASSWLFNPDYYPNNNKVTKEDVADRMEFIAKHGVYFING